MSLENQAAEKIPLLQVVKKTSGSFLYPQVMLLIVIPILTSAFFVFGSFWLTWGFWSGMLQDGLVLINPWWQEMLGKLPVFLNEILNGLGPITSFLLFLFLFALAFPLIIVLNLAITSVLASTYLVHFLKRREYPALEEKGSGAFIRGIWNTITSCILFILAWLVTLPLWLIPGAQIILPTILTAWLNRRICLFDALADFASPEEWEQIKVNFFGQSFALGVFTTILNYVPFAIVFSPVVTMVAFVHYGLGTLQLVRTTKSAKELSTSF
ncbi:MAG: hypothetical protein A2622_09820 [Bdellovibrionales bacterium RIFCSPHIGHO2_01_FULL_40_29]|nr:MAG: hypothetical protein A2622_09820 [Bdellovibrionales bacterium RIFCSPHIGHO2_01_FULL_40_29]OFZ32454.1 MAG: hypothetical protein A3D17_12840 [Bdellovibrionales bacterium RIFCSPHIGHO2_02_FULL_40_15]